MRFEIEQRYGGPVGAVLAQYTSADLYPALVDLPKMGGAELLDRTGPADLVTMRVRYRFVGELPSAATAVVDRDKLTWVDETAYDLDRARATTTLHPDHYPDRLTARATSTFTAEGDRTVRRITGELQVRAFLVGGKVEGAIVSGLRKYLAAECEVVTRRIADAG